VEKKTKIVEKIIVGKKIKIVEKQNQNSGNQNSGKRNNLVEKKNKIVAKKKTWAQSLPNAFWAHSVFEHCSVFLLRLP
jgi:hypothetical protein